MIYNRVIHGPNSVSNACLTPPPNQIGIYGTSPKNRSAVPFLRGIFTQDTEYREKDGTL